MCYAAILNYIRNWITTYLGLLAFWIAIVQCCRSFDYRHLFTLDKCWGYMSNILQFYHVCQQLSWWVLVTLSFYLVQVEWSFLGWLWCNKVCDGTEYLVVTNTNEMLRGCCLFECFDIMGWSLTCIKNSWCRKRCGIYSLGLELSPIMLCIFHFLRFLLFYFYFLQFSLFYFLFICFLSFFPFYLFSFCGCVTICHFNYLLRHQDASLTCIFVFLAGKYPKRNTHTHTHTHENHRTYMNTLYATEPSRTIPSQLYPWWCHLNLPAAATP